MKKIILFVVAVCISFSFVSFAKAPNRASLKASHAQAERFPGFNKLDPATKKAWKKAKTGDYLELLVKTNAVVKKNGKKQLDLVGYKYRSLINTPEKKTIATGKILASQLQCLAALEFVESIEGAKIVRVK
ncbi:MAG: hypothetical protein HYT75_01570 [Deltaproteobacteria bacterium]|nr:hypothetical protein [Deltaproteobacteria bacterium]MBI2341957.1 hypothetical protein [Deltaproteobacteria bacterium]